MPFELPQANLLGTLIEMVAYGGYVILFIEHMQIMYRRQSRKWSYGYAQLTSVLLFLFITAHICIDILRAMQLYTGDMGTPYATTTMLEHFNTLIGRTRTSIYNIITLISDLFLVYRCFIVWGSKYSTAFLPFLLYLVDIGVAIWATNSLNKARAGGLFAATLVAQRSRYLFAVTLAENLLCTFLIAYRIWTMQRQMAPFMTGQNDRYRQSLSSIIAIIIESAAIYSAILVALIITECIGSPSYFMLLNMISPIIGIVFSSILVRSSCPHHYSQEVVISALRFRENTGETM